MFTHAIGARYLVSARVISISFCVLLSTSVPGGDFFMLCPKFWQWVHFVCLVMYCVSTCYLFIYCLMIIVPDCVPCMTVILIYPFSHLLTFTF